MKKSELLEKLRLFKKKLEEHKDLYDQSFDMPVPLREHYPIKNIKELEMQRKELNRLFYKLEQFIKNYSTRWIMHHPATGMQWDIYREAIGNNVSFIKDPSLDAAIMDLEGIISIIESESEEEIDIIENKKFETSERKIKELERRLLAISARRRLSIVIILFLIIEAAIIILTIRYGEGLNIYQKLVGALSLPVTVFFILRYFGYIIIGKERIKALGWLFTKFFKL